ncbi:ABC transporter substrate-binding protein [Neobacillus drentensis]|uniref:ABC transporter substrate-binding protein n=1 Tax=Neobacillus drentensis TaxID=220684 RepID=UPI0028648C02|nr:ABC transporter substrate-binding protein [Neobacillus drentensis]MDR7238089.1 branched-chain amino acid transport system substrate-binding protein [Neobacillus drentensis]
MQSPKKYLITSLTLILVISIFLAGCSDRTSSNSGDSNVFKLGGLFTLTGAAALLGVSEKQGVQLAIDEVNKKGGLDINGKKIKVKLVDYDVGEDPTKAVEFTQRLLNNDKVNMIVGARENSQLAGELKITEPKKVIVFNATASTPLLSVGSKYGINFTDNGAIEKHSLIQLLADDPNVLKTAGLDVDRIKKVKRVALFGRNEMYVKQGVAGAKEATEKNGLEWAGEVLFPPGTTDFLPFITKLKELKPDAVILDTYSYEIMIPPLKEMLQIGGLDWTKGDIVLLGNDVMGSQNFVDTAAKEGLNLDGALTFSASPIASSEKMNQLLDKIFAKFGKDALYSGIASTYESAMMVFKAMEESGTVTDTDKVMKTLTEIEYDSARFKMTLDKDGQLEQPEYMLKIEDGKVQDTGISYLKELYWGYASKQVE